MQAEGSAKPDPSWSSGRQPRSRMSSSSLISSLRAAESYIYIILTARWRKRTAWANWQSILNFSVSSETHKPNLVNTQAATGVGLHPLTFIKALHTLRFDVCTLVCSSSLLIFQCCSLVKCRRIAISLQSTVMIL